MTEFNEKELGEKIAALCGRAQTDTDLHQRLLANTLSVLHAENIQFPPHMSDRLIAFINAALFQINQPLD